MWEGDLSSVTQTTADRSRCQPGFCAIDSFEACYSHNNTYTGSVWELTRWWHDSSPSAVTPSMGVLHRGHFYSLADTYKMTFTAAHSGAASAGKSSRKLKKKRKAVWPSASPKAAGLFGVRARPRSLLPPHCSQHRSGFAGPVPQAVYQIGSLIAFP